VWLGGVVAAVGGIGLSYVSRVDKTWLGEEFQFRLGRGYKLEDSPTHVRNNVLKTLPRFDPKALADANGMVTFEAQNKYILENWDYVQTIDPVHKMVGHIPASKKKLLVDLLTGK
jgi:hypothetical protein